MSDNLLEFYEHDLLFLLLLLNQQIDRQKCIVISHLKSTANRNKSLSN